MFFERDFAQLLRAFVVVSLDGVCIYTRPLEEHMEHLRIVFHRLKEYIGS
jgi:hypothetical protein